MPLLAGAAVVTPTPQPTPVEQIGVTWIAPDGTQWPLIQPGGDIRAQATNALGAGVQMQITSDPNPRGGVDVRHAHPLERYLILPVLVRAATHQQFAERWEALGDAFMQTSELGAGTLRVARPDGTRREISATYWSGWEGLPEHGWDWDVAPALTLMAPSPWWRGDPIVAIERRYEETYDYLDDYPQISGGQLLGATTAFNPGQTTGWPVWTITGPMSLLVATNHTTGEEFTLDPDWDDDGPLGLGDTVTITTDPPAIRGPAGEVWTGAVTGPLWGLRRGLNQLEFAATGADNGTSVRIEFAPLHQVT